MAIRDKFRRAVAPRKSDTTSSSASSSQSHHTTTETSTLASSAGSDSAALPIPTATTAPAASSSDERKGRSRGFTWRSLRNRGDKKKRSSSPDPREKPFTATNLVYQEMLGSYQITFGTSRTEQLWDENADISPGTSRQNSIDLQRN